MYGYDRKILIESDPSGVDIYTRPIRLAYGTTVLRHGLTKCGTTPFEMPTIGTGQFEIWASKDGKLLRLNIEAKSDAPIKLDFSKARPTIREESVCLERKVFVGMPEAYARISWGDPNDINRTITRFGTHEQWVYESGNYLYIDDGKVSSIQN